MTWMEWWFDFGYVFVSLLAWSFVAMALFLALVGAIQVAEEHGRSFVRVAGVAIFAVAVAAAIGSLALSIDRDIVPEIYETSRVTAEAAR